MRRVSPRRLFLYLACGVSSILLLINIEQRLIGTGFLGLQTTTSSPNKQKVEENLSRKLTEDLLGKDVLPVLTKDDEESSEKQVSPGRPRPEEPADQPKIDIGPDEHPPENTRPPLHLDRMSPLKPEDMDIPEYKDRAWYMKKGELLPVKTKPGEDVIHPPIWPENLPFEDRIPEQLMYVPSSVPENQEETETPLKKILLWNGASSWGGLVPGRGVFLKEKCPVSSCVISSNRAEADSSDLILFKDHFSTPSMLRSSNQIWMLYLLECPLHTQIFREQDIFNWTATYRSDSTVVAPYERWQYYNSNVKSIEQKRNYAANKTKQVAWFVSNCGARNERLQYARELSKYINVDIYGACGTERCPRAESSKCFNMLNTDYKFYLAFENSNCKDYITEKFFVNGLGHDVLPIAMGARYEDYLRAAPEKSFLHVDQFKDPEALAAYLHQLDKDDDKYNEYFQWKGTGEFVNTKFFCRVCSLLHDTQTRSEEYRSIPDVNNWWRGEGTCVPGSWNKKLIETSKNEDPEK